MRIYYSLLTHHSVNCVSLFRADINGFVRSSVTCPTHRAKKLHRFSVSCSVPLTISMLRTSYLA